MKRLIYAFIIFCIVGLVATSVWSEEETAMDIQQVETASAEEKVEDSFLEETDDIDRGYVSPDKSKIKKVSDEISALPESTGNVVLDQFNKFGDWLEDKSGNRFETQWNPQRPDDPALSPEHYGFEKDPAKGS